MISGVGLHISACCHFAASRPLHFEIVVNSFSFRRSSTVPPLMRSSIDLGACVTAELAHFCKFPKDHQKVFKGFTLLLCACVGGSFDAPQTMPCFSTNEWSCAASDRNYTHLIRLPSVIYSEAQPDSQPPSLLIGSRAWIRLKSMVATATIRIMTIAWVTFLGVLSRLNAILTVYLYAYSISRSIFYSTLHFSTLLHAHLDIHYTGNVHRNKNMKQACLMLYHNKNLLVRINNCIM